VNQQSTYTGTQLQTPSFWVVSGDNKKIIVFSPNLAFAGLDIASKQG
jgi:hypothetical protein